MSAFFVTGAGTEIGKTYVACALLQAWRAQAVACAALKPVVSGIDPQDIAASDPARLLAALGEDITSSSLDRMSPFRFRAPLAPQLAAKAEGRVLDFNAIVAMCRARIAETSGMMLIEGAGGVMSPLTDTKTQLDLIAALNIPTLFVTGTYLGAVSHALTGLACLRHAGADIAAIVVSESADSVGLDATQGMIGAHASEPVHKAPRGEERALGDLAEALVR